jgi:PAS domain S-box-containing protein
MVEKAREEDRKSPGVRTGSRERPRPGSAPARNAASPREDLLAAALGSALDCVIVMDGAGAVVEFNPAAERTFGYRREEVLGKELAELLIPRSLRERHRRALRGLHGARHGPIVGRRVELTAMRADGSEFPIELSVTSLEGEPPMFAGFVRDVTERRRAAEAKDLLAAAGAAFDTSLDPLQTMRTIARTAVPQLAELCVIDLIRDDGLLGDSVVAAADERLARRLEELRARYPLDITGTHPVARAIRSREPVVVHDLDEPDVREQVAQSDEHRQLMLQAGYRSAVVIRLTARGRLLGALSFLHIDHNRDFEPDHLALMQDLAARAAMALDNANLYAERARVAQMLQRSLLPEALPVLPGVQLASVYRPAGVGSEAGGDFYDVFDVPSGCWLVVGDVCGKGTEAAIVTSIVRHSIRALTFERSSPAAVLSGVNEVMRSHELAGRFATAIVARLEHGARPARALISSAGHPPPVLLDATGHASCPPVAGTLLGVLPEPRLADHEIALDPGATLILYTDGLTDAGAPARELGPEDLCRELSGRSSGPPRALLSHLEQLALHGGRGQLRDDVAILAARLD